MEILQKVRELHIAAKEVKEFQARTKKATVKKVCDPKVSDGRFRKFGAEEGRVRNGGEGGKRDLPPNHESSINTWVYDVGERGARAVSDDHDPGHMETSGAQGVLQEMAEYDDMPELCSSNLISNDEE